MRCLEEIGYEADGAQLAALMASPHLQSKQFDALKSGDASGFLSEVMSNAVAM